MKLFTFFALLCFASIIFIVTSQKEETASAAQDLDVPPAISNSTNDTLNEVHHGFKSKVGKVWGKVKSKITKVVNKVKGSCGGSRGGGSSGGGSRGGGSSGGGSSGGGSSGGGSSGGSSRYRYNRIGSKSGSDSDGSGMNVLFIVLGVGGSLLLVIGITSFFYKKLSKSEVREQNNIDIHQ